MAECPRSEEERLHPNATEHKGLGEEDSGCPHPASQYHLCINNWNAFQSDKGRGATGPWLESQFCTFLNLSQLLREDDTGPEKRPEQSLRSGSCQCDFERTAPKNMFVFEICSSVPGTNVCRLRLDREPVFSVLAFSRIWFQDCLLDDEGRMKVELGGGE